MTRPSQAAGLLMAFYDVWPDISRDRRNQPGYSVLAARTVIEVARYFGERGIREQPVSIAVLNDAAWQYYTAGTPISEWPPEAHSIGTLSTDDTTDGQWAGHLVVAGGGLVADYAARQFSRVMHDIHMPQAWIMPTPAAPPPWVFVHDEGVRMVMGPVDAAGYKRTPEWRRGYRDYAAAAIKAIRDRQEDPAEVEAAQVMSAL